MCGKNSSRITIVHRILQRIINKITLHDLSYIYIRHIQKKKAFKMPRMYECKKNRFDLKNVIVVVCCNNSGSKIVKIIIINKTK